MQCLNNLVVNLGNQKLSVIKQGDSKISITDKGDQNFLGITWKHLGTNQHFLGSEKTISNCRINSHINWTTNFFWATRKRFFGQIEKIQLLTMATEIFWHVIFFENFWWKLLLGLKMPKNSIDNDKKL